MEEKKKVKISLTGVALIIAILIIVAMGMYIIFDKTETNKEIAELKDKVDNKTSMNEINPTNNTVTISSENTAVVENTSDVLTPVTTDIPDSLPTERREFGDELLREVLGNYLELVGTMNGSPEAMLNKLGILEGNEVTDKSSTNDNFKPTNLNYSEFKNVMVGFMSEEWFDTHFTEMYKNINGKLYYFDGGATGVDYEIEEINLKGDYNDDVFIAKVSTLNLDGSKTTDYIEFHIAIHYGGCIITYCDL